MHPQRNGWHTVLWLTLYVGWLPLIVAGGLAWLAIALGATHDDFAGIFAVFYLALVYLGAHLFARHFERS